MSPLKVVVLFNSSPLLIFILLRLPFLFFNICLLLVTFTWVLWMAWWVWIDTIHIAWHFTIEGPMWEVILRQLLSRDHGGFFKVKVPYYPHFPWFSDINDQITVLPLFFLLYKPTWSDPMSTMAYLLLNLSKKTEYLATSLSSSKYYMNSSRSNGTCRSSS